MRPWADTKSFAFSRGFDLKNHWSGTSHWNYGSKGSSSTLLTTNFCMKVRNIWLIETFVQISWQPIELEKRARSQIKANDSGYFFITVTNIFFIKTIHFITRINMLVQRSDFLFIFLIKKHYFQSYMKTQEASFSCFLFLWYIKA